MEFEPIAIVGRGCLLPGCATPQALWQTILEGQTHITRPPEGAWRVEMSRILADPPPKPDKAWTDLGGYIHGFEKIFDPTCSLLEAELLTQLDPLVQWSIFAGKQALESYGHVSKTQAMRTGVILGNLSYPSLGHSSFAESVLLKKHFSGTQFEPLKSYYLNRFNSGLPAMLLAKALGLGAGAFSLDAACASGLYAIKLACDRLQNRSADLMLAGAVNAADPLFIHVGFSALNALSVSGQSRPFHRDADGLVPSEGAAFTLLKRLKDAEKDGDRILGVILGIGLSNDGRTGGFLSPSVDGQVRCMQQAYQQAELHPSEISLVECHATGTPTGDAAEIKSMSSVFSHSLPIGSLKANLGHLITTSGVAGLLKVIGAMEHGTLPPTPHANPVSAALDSSNFHVLEKSETWDATGTLYAGVSSFGFGGNNAHLIVSNHAQKFKTSMFSANPETKKAIAVVAMEVRTHLNEDLDSFSELVFGEDHSLNPYLPKDQVAFNVKDLTFPPADLKQALGQQLLLLKTAQSALKKVPQVQGDQSGVYIGMGTDSEICRLGLRLRLRDLLDPNISDEAWLKKAENTVSDALTAAGVVGKMPNIPANRLNNQFNFQGPGFTVSREELSGDTALDLAIQAIQRGEITTAVVGAVDLSRELVHQAALEQCIEEKEYHSEAFLPGDKGFSSGGADAAVVFILKDLQTAKQQGDTILAVIDDQSRNVSFSFGNGDPLLRMALGHAHAASGLLHHALAIRMLQARQAIDCKKENSTRNFEMRPILPKGSKVSVEVRNTSFEHAFAHETSRVTYIAGNTQHLGVLPEIRAFAADSPSELLSKLESNQIGRTGSFRCAVVGLEQELSQKVEQAVFQIKNTKIHNGWNKNGIFYRESPVSGEMAFAFTGAASAYPNMGRDLLAGLPMLTDKLQRRLANVDEALGWAYKDKDPQAFLPFYQLAGSSAMCQLHAIVSQDLLGLKPQAALGLSSGETNAMFAFDAWSDMDGLLNDIKASNLYNLSLGGPFLAIQQYWDTKDPVQWDNWRILAPVSEVRKALAKQDRVYLTIINTEFDCVIGGDRSGCQNVLHQFEKAQSIPLGHDIAVHCEAVTPFKDTWYSIHSRPTTQPEGVRFYSNYFGGSYSLTKDSVAEALTGQALGTVDFPRMIQKAWQDGVRIFIEHGPRGNLSSAIDTILEGRPHCAIPFDKTGVNSLLQVHYSVAELWCAGAEVNLDLLAKTAGSDRLNTSATDPNAPTLSFTLRKEMGPVEPLVPREEPNPALYFAPVLHTGPENGQIMLPAPPLARLIPSLPLPAMKRPEPSGTQGKPVVKTLPPKIFPNEVPPGFADNAQSTRQTFSGKNKETSPAVGERSSEPINEVSGSAGILAATYRQLTEAHKHYLEKQETAFKQYTALMHKMQRTLFGENPDPEPAFFEPERIVQSSSRNIRAKQSDQEPTLALVKTEPPEIRIENPVTTLTTQVQRPGPKLDRQDLITVASGKISSIFGPLFEKQDDYAIQVRMPEPPLLLCDRVLGIEGEPGSLKTGTIWTETDVLADSWYLHHGRMPSGIFIEAGQADLLLISWLGIDFINRGQRAYRLLGCELVFHGDLPKPGDTLSYEIKVDGHAKQGDVRLFFFHYDCTINGEKRISVRHGQAGFFSVDELENSAGVLWHADKAEYSSNATPPEHPQITNRRTFSREQVAAYTQGDMATCFGSSFYRANTHTRSPRSAGGKFNFIGEVTSFDPLGGPAGRGYLRAESPVHSSDWFFEGHFKNDPCMPGTLMADACLQMMAFYMTATGRTLYRDGWRFQPVQETKFLFICRGQVLPMSKRLTYEVFVDEIIDGDKPILFAHVLCSVDGRKAFLCERFGLQLVPDWPLDDRLIGAAQKHDDRSLADIQGFPLDQLSLLNCALGRPSLAFGKGFERFDGVKRAPRLPGPPYHFMTRISRLVGEMGSMQTGAEIDVLYDIPPDAWYFRENASDVMPFCVLMELALQPCGWLSSFSLSPEASRNELLFRNLDGNLKLYREILPCDGTILSRVRLKSLSKAGDMIIVGFDVSCSIQDEKVADMDTVFGFFPPQALKNQKGLAISEHDAIMLELEENYRVELHSKQGPYFDGPGLKLPSSKLLMLDRITGYWPQGGRKKTGVIRAEKQVRPEEWFFKAHFFQDPVQPGSLGIEAMLQLIQIMMLEGKAGEGIKNPRFEPINVDRKIEWHYRGQVVPENKVVTLVFEALEWGSTSQGPYVMGEAAYWVDGLKIYHAPEIGMRIISSEPREPLVEAVDWLVVRDYWVKKNHMQHRFIHDLASGLIREWVDQIVYEDAEDFKRQLGKPVLFLANHETSVESFLFLTLMGQVTQMDIKAIAKDEHRESWIGRVDEITQVTLGPEPGVGILFFERSKPAQLPELLEEYACQNKIRPTSLLVHTDGTRSTHARQTVQNVSSVFLDFAIKNQLAIIPVCFTGAQVEPTVNLPLNHTKEEKAHRLEIPFGKNRQTYIIGPSINPGFLAGIPFPDRSKYVLTQMNRLIIDYAKPATGHLPEQESLLSERFRIILESLPDTCEETQKLLAMQEPTAMNALDKLCCQLIDKMGV